MCPNIGGNTLTCNSATSDSKLINHLIYNEHEEGAARKDAKKLMRGAIKAIVCYVKHIYYFYHHLNDTFLESNLYKWVQVNLMSQVWPLDDFSLQLTLIWVKIQCNQNKLLQVLQVTRTIGHVGQVYYYLLANVQCINAKNFCVFLCNQLFCRLFVYFDTTKLRIILNMSNSLAHAVSDAIWWVCIMSGVYFCVHVCGDNSLGTCYGCFLRVLYRNWLM